MIVKKNGWKRIGIFPLVMVLYVGNGTLVYAQTYTDTQEMTAETQAQLEQAVAAALAGIESSVDKSVLDDLISQAAALDTSAYDETSSALLAGAIASARQVSADTGASQSMVDKHIRLLEAAAEALYGKTDANTVYDGVYQMDGRLWHATSDQVSMGNFALVKPFELIKQGDSLTLRIECQTLTTKLGKTDFTGYLAKMWYFPDCTDEDTTPFSMEGNQELVSVADENGVEDFSTGDENENDSAEAAVQEDQVAAQALSSEGVEVGVESWYDTYDSYNDPKKGTDANVKGSKYPHYITMPVSLNQGLVWVQLYVPVMESISAGGGLQYAKLYLDWNTLTQISGTDSDKSALTDTLTQAQAVLAGLQKDSQGFAREQIDMLAQAVTAAQAVCNNINVDQTIVDNETKVLQAAIHAASITKVDSDKSQLKKAIETADTYLNETEVEFDAVTLETLRSVRNYAQEVYDDVEASQTQVNKCVSAIDEAISNLVIVGGDRRQLKKALNTAKEYLNDGDNYTATALKALQSVYDRALAVYKDENASQDEIDAQTEVLTYTVSTLKKIGDVLADKGSLYEMILTASNLAGQDSVYTAATIKSLKKAITAAEKVYKSDSSVQSEVDAQVSALSAAIRNLEKKAASDTSNSSDSNSNSSGLDVKNLADGVYSVTGNMVKTDKSTASMSDEAINHTIKLTVKNGKYTLTLDFKGLTINGQLGYLGTLKYFKTGYTLDKNGTPQGTTARVNISSYQKYTTGALVSDNFGTDYPDIVTFPLIKEALSDGYVPLQVFVPIMDSISKGTGTQAVFLKLNWSSVKKTNSKDSGFNDDSSNGDGSGSGNTNNTGGSGNAGGNSLLNGGSTLTGGGSKLSGSTSSLKSGSSLKSSASLSKSSTSLKSAGAKSLSSSKGTALKSSAKASGDAGTTTLTSSGISEDQSSGTTWEASAEQEDSSSKNTSKAIIPVVVSGLAALSGVLYKVKSRAAGRRKKK